MICKVLILMTGLTGLCLAVEFNSLEQMQKSGWQAQGGAVLVTGRAADGTLCPRAAGDGKGNYGGLRWSGNLDLSGAGGEDYITFKVRQNIESGLYFLLQNTRDQIFHRTFKVPKNAWTEIRLALQPSEWSYQGGGDQVPDWGRIQLLSIYHEGLKQEGLFLEVSDLRILVGGRDRIGRLHSGKSLPVLAEVQLSEGQNLFECPEAVYRIERNGVISAVWRRSDGAPLIEQTETFYHLQSRDGDCSASDRRDEVVEWKSGKEELLIRCRNPELPELQISKRFFREGNRLVRQLEFINQGEQKVYLTPSTEVIFHPAFRQDSYYFGGSFVGPLLPASSIMKRERVTRFNNSAKAMILSNSETSKGSFCNYRRKLGDLFLFPWWTGAIGQYVEYPNQLYYTPEGWDLAYGTIDLEPGGGRNSTEDIFLFFHGSWFDFLDRIYASDPEAGARLSSISAPPAWLGNVLMQYNYYRDGFAGLKQVLEMTDEGDIMVLFDLSCNWADYRVEKNGLDGYWGGHISGPELKSFVKQLQALSPRIKVGLYQFVSSVLKTTPLFQEHPEWFRRHDKEGNESILFPGVPMNYTCMVNRPELRQELLNQFRNVKEYLGVDFIYLDETKAISQIDWDTGELLHENDWNQLWEGMRELVAKYKELPLFFNGRGNPFGDINFIEAGHQLHPSVWRDFAGMVFATELFLKNRPGARISLLYWHGQNDYVNRVLALGLLPEKEVDRPVQRGMPFIHAAYEIGDVEPVDMSYSPDWKKDAQTQVESYTVRRLNGGERICSFINRDPDNSQCHIRMDLTEYQNSPITIWQYLISADKALRNPLSDKESGAMYQASGWRENVVTSPALCHIGSAPAEFSASFTIPHGQMLQLVISEAPAGIYSRNGVPLNFFFNHSRGLTVHGREFPLQISSTLKDAEIILPFAAQVMVNGKTVDCRPMWFGNRLHSIVTVPQGNSRVDARQLPQPADNAEVTARLAGDTIQAEGAGTFALARDGNTVYTGPSPIPVPKHSLGGEYQLSTLHAEAKAVSITLPPGKKSSVWQIAYAPRRPARQQLQPVRKALGDGEILQAATASSDSARIWLIQPELDPFITIAEPERAMLTAGTSRKIEDYQGSAFAGFELRNVHKLQFELNSTFATAVSRNSRNPHITEWRRTRREFAGIVVDFRSAGQYHKRVALSLGVRHKDCDTMNPAYGKGGLPDQFFDLGNHLEKAKSDLVLDLRPLAPGDWDGTVWFSIGTDCVTPGRHLQARIVAVNDRCRNSTPEEIESAQIMQESGKPRKLLIPFLRQGPPKQGFEDPAWPQESQIGRFFLLGEPALAQMQTNVRIAYDHDNLYITARCHETLRQKPIVGHNQIWENDDFEIFLSPAPDQVFQYLIDGDGKCTLLKNGVAADPSAIRSKITLKNGQYWDVDIILPFSVTGVGPEGAWEGNFCRNRLAGNGLPGENSTWGSLSSRYFAHGEAGTLAFELRKTLLANFGIPGGSSADVLRLEISKAQAFKPDLSIVMAGTNDALNSSKLTSPEQYEQNMRQIIQELQTAGSKVLLINLPPCVEEILLTRHKASAYGDMPPSERILACNRIISDLAREFQLPLVDFHQIMMKRGDLAGAKSLLRNLVNEKSADGVHPTAEGYRLLAKAIASSIKQQHLPHRRIACLGDSITYGAHITGAGGVSGDTYPGQLAGMLD